MPIDIIRETYFKRSRIPSRYSQDTPLIPEKVDLDSFKSLANIEHNVKDFVKNGSNLFIFSSNVGNGKTSWATKIGKAYIDYASDYAMQCPVLFVNIPSFLFKKKSAMTDASLRDEVVAIEGSILNARLVIWDDIAIKDLSEYDKEQLYVWIDTRTSNCKSNIYTSNIGILDLESIIGARLYDRIVSYSTQICLKGHSRRK